jgi:hypothetical protein
MPFRKYFVIALLSFLTGIISPFALVPLSEAEGAEATTTEPAKPTPEDTKAAGASISSAYANDGGKVCTINFAYSDNSAQDHDTNNENASKENIKILDDESAIKVSEGRVACGKTNTYTNYVEKGDCTANGVVVTETSEIIGRNVNLEEGKNKVVSVYKGSCCFIVKAITDEKGEQTSYDCEETRDVYFEEGEDAFATCNAGALNCQKRQWIIGTSGIGIIKVYVKLLYTWGAGIVGFIAVAVIVVSGIQISLSGVSGDITEAKDRITQSIMGIVLLFLSAIILYVINPDFFG